MLKMIAELLPGAEARIQVTKLRGTPARVAELIAEELGFPEGGDIEVKLVTGFARFTCYRHQRDVKVWVLVRQNKLADTVVYVSFQVYDCTALRFTEMTSVKPDYYIDITGEPMRDLTKEANALLEKARRRR